MTLEHVQDDQIANVVRQERWIVGHWMLVKYVTWRAVHDKISRSKV